MREIVPKQENEGIGFSYTVTDEQIAQHQKLSISQIFDWLDSTRKLAESVQTEKEKELALNYFYH
jgi:hypothetical protein